MQRAILVAAVAAGLILSLAAPARATEVGRRRKFGLGLVLGNPGGVTAKYWISEKNALDFSLGLGGYRYGQCWRDTFGRKHCDTFYGHTSFAADYLWQIRLLKSQAQLDLHFGVGGRLWLWRYGGPYGDAGNLDLSVRAPVGVDLTFNNPGFLELYLEVSPSLHFISPGPDVEGGLGIRFYF